MFYLISCRRYNSYSNFVCGCGCGWLHNVPVHFYINLPSQKCFSTSQQCKSNPHLIFMLSLSQIRNTSFCCLLQKWLTLRDFSSSPSGSGHLRQRQSVRPSDSAWRTHLLPRPGKQRLRLPRSGSGCHCLRSAPHIWRHLPPHGRGIVFTFLAIMALFFFFNSLLHFPPTRYHLFIVSGDR